MWLPCLTAVANRKNLRKRDNHIPAVSECFSILFFSPHVRHGNFQNANRQMQSWDARVCRAGNRSLPAASGRLSSLYRVTIREFVQGWWTIFLARSTSAWIVRGYRSTSNFRWLSIRMYQATVDRSAPRCTVPARVNE